MQILKRSAAVVPVAVVFEGPLGTLETPSTTSGPPHSFPLSSSVFSCFIKIGSCTEVAEDGAVYVSKF